MKIEIVERSSGFWVVNGPKESPVGPFDSVKEANIEIDKMNTIGDTHIKIGDWVRLEDEPERLLYVDSWGEIIEEDHTRYLWLIDEDGREFEVTEEALVHLADKIPEETI